VQKDFASACDQHGRSHDSFLRHHPPHHVVQIRCCLLPAAIRRPKK
jgi:hypothetical protein